MLALNECKTTYLFVSKINAAVFAGPEPLQATFQDVLKEISDEVLKIMR